MRERILTYIRHLGLMRPGDRVGIAVSGGADSVALLRILLELRGELGVVLRVVHANHGIRGAEAADDQRFVAALAASNGLEFHCESFDTPAYARDRGLSLEAAGRTLRYQYFEALLASALDTIATAHTIDDQAETVLLRIMRGAGTRGIAAIYPQLRVASGESPAGSVVRPLLQVRRAELREYLQGLGQEWREDASNLDVKHTRNRVRHVLLPLIEREFNPAIVPVLAEMAEAARSEEEYWDGYLQRLLGNADCLRLERSGLLQQPIAVQRRLVRRLGDAAGSNLEFQHVDRILEIVAQVKPLELKRMELPEGWVAVCTGQQVALQRKAEQRRPKSPRHDKKQVGIGNSTAEAVTSLLREPGAHPGGQLGEGQCLPQVAARQGTGMAGNYEYPLPIPGEVRVKEIGMLLKVLRVAAGECSSGYNQSQPLDPNRLGSPLVVRNWRPGDRFRTAHSKSPRKVKELLLRRRVAPPQRAFWPVVASGTSIVWIPGVGTGAEFLAGTGTAEVVVIEEVTADH